MKDFFVVETSPHWELVIQEIFERGEREGDPYEPVFVCGMQGMEPEHSPIYEEYSRQEPVTT